MYILGADIGGTKTLLGIAQYDATGWQICRQHRFDNRNYNSLTDIITEFLTEQTPPDHAMLAVAGPVRDKGKDSIANLTNLDWSVSKQQLQQTTGIGKIQLINDFSALGYSLPLLRAEDLLTLQHGNARGHDPMAMLGAGTGLGQALVVRASLQTRVYPSEGGHTDFAPQGEQQIELYRFLAAEYGHVSIERILSGSGIENLYRFLSAGGQLSAAEISQAGMAQPESNEGQSLKLFASIYGAHAGNVALHYLPDGGLFLAGGVTAKLADYLANSHFLDSFLDKGRFGDYLGTIPLHIIRNDAAGLTGALQGAWFLTRAVSEK